MNATTTLDRPSSRTATAWKTTLIAIPIVTLALLLWLRQLEVNALRLRTVSFYGTVPEFVLLNQDGKNFGSAQLRGKIWIADFIYTTCPGPCPMISTRMSELQKPLDGETPSRARSLGFSDRPAIDDLQFIAQWIQTRGLGRRR